MMYYREISSPADLGQLVLSFWEFKVEAESLGPFAHEIFPDGCISLIYRRNPALKFAALLTSELHTRSVTVPVFDRDIFWGMRIQPAAGAGILGMSPAAVTKHLWDPARPEYGIFDRPLLEALGECDSLEGAAELFAARLRDRATGPVAVDERVRQACALIEASAGELRIAELATAVGLGIRQLERRFKRASGLSPKQYARIRRLRAAAAMLAGAEPVNWAERAAAMGFADQAHLSHEVSTITGNSPRTLAKKVKKIDHGTLV